MASVPALEERSEKAGDWLADLSNPKLSIGGPMFDALLFWGSPLLAFIAVSAAIMVAQHFPGPVGLSFTNLVLLASAVLTYAHLIAVAPRAYLNRQVFETHRLKLTIVPPLLLLALVSSSTVLVLATVIAVFWDIYHSAAQNFGIGRIYDAKAGNNSETLRSVDLGLNWFLYVGPLVSGASLMWHFEFMEAFSTTSLSGLATLPGVISHGTWMFKVAGVVGWSLAIAYSAWRYREAAKAGYKLPAHKAVLLITTGLVSLLAWGFSSPIVAIASINIYHALQYFGMVWLKEGNRMADALGPLRRYALPIFLGGCALVGFTNNYLKDINAGVLLAPFVACSLLHFWFDGFVWSVRSKHV
ncbi:MAG: hypothetical protein JSS20_01750 [Proteobacteria bacterium]|nr:hypothetical protein [Pseudomonadota bacterium]